MGLTSALNTSLNGLSLNESKIDVLGNNISNAGTNGFKASSVRFQTQLSRTLTIGSKADATNGGTNPTQVGLGAVTAAVSRDFTQGSISTSTSPSDLAIEGNGFFVLNGTDGREYSRAGNFSLNSNSELINDQGQFVQGYGVDPSFNLVTTTTGNLSVPLGQLHVAQQTSNLNLSGALYPQGALATKGSEILTEALTDSSTSAAATSATLLTNVKNVAGTALFSVGQKLDFTPTKGGRALTPVTYTVTSSSTLSDLATMIADTIGIQSGSGIPNDAGTGTQPGVTINASGQIDIVGNSGLPNDLNALVGDLKADGSIVPISFTKAQSANGDGTSTDFIAYDSLGQAMDIRVTAILQARSSTTNTTTYRYYVESNDNHNSADANIAMASGTIDFDATGKVKGVSVGGGLSQGTTADVNIYRSGSAAINQQKLTINFANVSGISSASAGSTLNLASQDGSGPGTLQSYVIDQNGVINGVFDNGITRPLGQVVLSRFANTAGLLETSGTNFKEGVSSGAAQIVTAGNFGAGTIKAGAVELSNTDIGKSLVDLITASSNYRGNARVISAVDQLVNELLQLGK